MTRIRSSWFGFPEHERIWVKYDLSNPGFGIGVSGR